MRSLVLMSILIGSFVIVQNACGMISIAKVSVRVIDEDGTSVENADVAVNFERGDGEKIPAQGFTGGDGNFEVMGQSSTNHITINVRKDSYYESYYNYNFQEYGFGRWKPWNPELTIVLRKIRNQVPMYARSSIKSKEIIVPALGKEFGFDLMTYDWVIPYGRGEYVDILFKIDKSVTDRKNFNSTLTMIFPDRYAGIQIYREDPDRGSIFRLPREAPIDKYESVLGFGLSKNTGSSVKMDTDFQHKDINYIFRTRTKIVDNQLIKAMYGKILGPIQYSPLAADTAKIYFTYYLNPDYTRNLEFDPKQNLFGFLPPLEQVGIQ